MFLAADRPYGLIEGQVTRDEARPADAWLAVPGRRWTTPEQLLGCLSVPRWAEDVLAGSRTPTGDALIAAADAAARSLCDDELEAGPVRPPADRRAGGPGMSAASQREQAGVDPLPATPPPGWRPATRRTSSGSGGSS